jgi:hypothetical protein
LLKAIEKTEKPVADYYAIRSIFYQTVNKTQVAEDEMKARELDPRTTYGINLFQ